MSYGGIYHFRQSELGAIEASTRNELEACREIWNNVQQQLLGMVERGQVDESVGEIVRDRGERFRSESSRFDEGVDGQNLAVRRVQDVGAEGGAAMRRSMMGRG